MKKFPKSIIFDLDGVITQTATVHFQAWKQLFDEVLEAQNLPEFTHDDYLKYVDGRSRYDGIKHFLSSRNIELSFGSPEDDENKKTICGLGNKKNKYFQKELEKSAPEDLLFSSSVEFLKKAKAQNIKTGLVTSSKNGHKILEKTGITDLFDAIITGVEIAEKNLPGKPKGDSFVFCTKLLNTSPKLSVVIEDSIAGVQAGKDGNFGLIVGIARSGNMQDFLDNGANLVVKDLSELKIENLEARRKE